MSVSSAIHAKKKRKKAPSRGKMGDAEANQRFGKRKGIDSTDFPRRLPRSKCETKIPHARQMLVKVNGVVRRRF